MHDVNSFRFVFLVKSFENRSRGENQNKERKTPSSMLIKSLLSLTLILGLNCVSLGMTRINKLGKAVRRTRQIKEEKFELFIGGNR